MAAPRTTTSVRTLGEERLALVLHLRSVGECVGELEQARQTLLTAASAVSGLQAEDRAVAARVANGLGALRDSVQRMTAEHGRSVSDARRALALARRNMADVRLQQRAVGGVDGRAISRSCLRIVEAALRISDDTKEALRRVEAHNARARAAAQEIKTPGIPWYLAGLVMSFAPVLLPLMLTVDVNAFFGNSGLEDVRTALEAAQRRAAAAHSSASAGAERGHEARELGPELLADGDLDYLDGVYAELQAALQGLERSVQ